MNLGLLGRCPSGGVGAVCIWNAVRLVQYPHEACWGFQLKAHRVRLRQAGRLRIRGSGHCLGGEWAEGSRRHYAAFQVNSADCQG